MTDPLEQEIWGLACSNDPLERIEVERLLLQLLARIQKLEAIAAAEKQI